MGTALKPLLPLLLILFAAFASADDLVVTTDDDQELHVQVYANDADTPLLIWLEELDDARPAFAALMLDLQANGFSVWRVNLLEDFFLERTPANVRGLSGKGVLALLRAAEASGQPYLLVAADRMAIPALRGASRWQAEMPAGHRFRGIAMVYPNLFGAAPPAGVEPEIVPIARQVSVPIYLLQPERGALRSRLPAMKEALVEGGAPTVVRLVRGVRDWYFMHERGEDRDEDAAVAAMPGHLQEAFRLLAGFAARMPRGIEPTLPDAPTRQAARGLTEFPDRPPAPGYHLLATRGGDRSLDDVRGKVALINFWASWCPPCVHEIPSMNRLAATFSRDDFEIVSINFKEEPSHILQFMEKVQVDFPVLIDPQGQTSDAWKVFAFPSSFLIDREGRIRYSINTAIEWDTAEPTALIEALIAEGR